MEYNVVVVYGVYGVWCMEWCTYTNRLEMISSLPSATFGCSHKRLHLYFIAVKVRRNEFYERKKGKTQLRNKPFRYDFVWIFRYRCCFSFSRSPPSSLSLFLFLPHCSIYFIQLVCLHWACSSIMLMFCFLFSAH